MRSPAVQARDCQAQWAAGGPASRCQHAVLCAQGSAGTRHEGPRHHRHHPGRAAPRPGRPRDKPTWTSQQQSPDAGVQGAPAPSGSRTDGWHWPWNQPRRQSTANGIDGGKRSKPPFGGAGCKTVPSAGAEVAATRGMKMSSTICRRTWSGTSVSVIIISLRNRSKGRLMIRGVSRAGSISPRSTARLTTCSTMEPRGFRNASRSSAGVGPRLVVVAAEHAADQGDHRVAGCVGAAEQRQEVAPEGAGVGDGGRVGRTAVAGGGPQQVFAGFPAPVEHGLAGLGAGRDGVVGTRSCAHPVLQLCGSEARARPTVDREGQNSAVITEVGTRKGS